MPIRFRGFFEFLFNGGRGIRTSQLDGNYVERVGSVGEQLRIQRSSGGTEVGSFYVDLAPQRARTLRRIAVKQSAVFNEADFASAPSQSTVEQTSVPDFTGSDYHIGIWWDGTDPSIDTLRLYREDGILTGSPYNYISNFGDPVALQVGGVDGYYISTTNPVASNRGGDSIVSYSTAGIPTFLRRTAVRAEDDGNVFTEADFLGTHGFSSLSAFITVDETVLGTDGGEQYYQSIAIPSSTTPISGVFSRSFGDAYDQPVDRFFEDLAGGLLIDGVAHQVWRGTIALNSFGQDKTWLVAQVPAL